MQYLFLMYHFFVTLLFKVSPVKFKQDPMPAEVQHQHQRHGNHHAQQTLVPKLEFSPTNNNNHHHRSAEGNGKVSYARIYFFHLFFFSSRDLL